MGALWQNVKKVTVTSKCSLFTYTTTLLIHGEGEEGAYTKDHLGAAGTTSITIHRSTTS